MVARNKSKKTTSSKTKKTGAVSSAKPRSKRTPKAASSSSVRNRVSKSKPASNTQVARKTSKTSRAKIKNAATKLSKRKRTSSNTRTMTPCIGRGEEARQRRQAKSGGVEEPEQGDKNRGCREAGVRRPGAFEGTGSEVVDSKPKRRPAGSSRHGESVSASCRIKAKFRSQRSRPSSDRSSGAAQSPSRPWSRSKRPDRRKRRSRLRRH